MTQENGDTLLATLHSNLGSHKLKENLPEISPIMTTCFRMANALKDRTKPEKPQVEEWHAGWDTMMISRPRASS